ncbi:MAG: hypothetical protein HY554_16640 [Elusimicrobia bacterium]|nr:hypothetical protein [Elusimicrobiota bacterium]
MSLSRVRGQGRALRLLRPLLASRRLPPALLFFGPEGVGKALAAGELAKALNCLSPASDGDACDRGLSRGSAALGESVGKAADRGLSRGSAALEGAVGKAADACGSCSAAAKGIDPDLKRVNAAYQAGLREEEAERQRTIRVDTVRHLVKDMEMTSLTGRWKVAVVEDAERLELEAANALLKSLEEPPPRTLWILVSARRDRLLPTIVSRCHRVPFGALSAPDVAAVLRAAGAAPEEIRRLARAAEGSPGRALALRGLKAADPEEWTGDALAPFRLAEALPRELHLARPIVEAHLRRIAWRLRDRGGPGHRGAAAGLRELARLSTYLRSNADPRLILTLAALESERVP